MSATLSPRRECVAAPFSQHVSPVGDSVSSLIIDPAMGMAGDMFVAALVGLGAPAERAVEIMEASAEPIGGADVAFHREPLPDATLAWRIAATDRTTREPLELHQATEFLTASLWAAGVADPYASFAARALGILGHAEQHAHAGFHHAEHHDKRVVLHEAQDIIMDLAATAWGLQWLGVSLEHASCHAPVYVGGGHVRFSHGRFAVPTPATAQILAHHAIPWVRGPMDFEQLTPTGAAILAALRPRFVSRRAVSGAQRVGVGLGSRTTVPPNALTLTLEVGSPLRTSAGGEPEEHTAAPPGEAVSA